MTEKVDEPVVHATLRAKLYDHCLGSGDPSGALLERGVFPKNWVGKYKQLLKSAANVWVDNPSWPREIVLAIHYTSMYLPIRYDAWRIGSGSRNEKTEKLLSEVRVPGELFFMSARSPDAGAAVMEWDTGTEDV